MRLSVIIPAYNCADTIEATLDSVLAQEVSGMEVIAVNDGSTDRTGEVLKRYARADERVRVFTTENKGPAHARNFGIAAAQGGYIAFADSDDLLRPGMYAALLSLAEENGLDVAACGYTMETVTGKSVRRQDFVLPSFLAGTPEEFRKRLTELIRAHLMYVVWNKLFRLDFLREQNLSFSDFLSGEDRLFNIESFAGIRKFGLVGAPYYRYILHGGGTLANRYVENRFEAALACHRAMLAAYKKMGILDGAARTGLDFQYVKSVMACFTQFNAKDCPLARREKRGYVKKVLENPELSEAIQKSDNAVFYSRIVNAVLKSGNISLILFMAKGIYWMQSKLSPLYLKLKHNVKTPPEGDAQ